MTPSAVEGERLSRLEGAYEHLAAKADVERVRSELKGMNWMTGAGIARVGAFASTISLAASFAFR